MTPAESELSDLVRRVDVDRFLSTAFMHRAAKRHVLAIYAFNAELAKVADVTSEPMIGEIRLQWWREAIEEIYSGRVRQHTVVLALRDAVDECGLERSLLDRMIDARSFELYTEPMASEGALLEYCRQTAGSVISLSASVCDPDTKHASIREVSNDAGIAIALANILRSTAYHASMSQCFFPVEDGPTYHFDVEKFRSGRIDPSIEGAVLALADRARQSLENVRAAAGTLSDRAFAPLLPCSLVDRYLQRVQTNVQMLFERPIDCSMLQKQWTYLQAYVRKRV